MEGELGLPQNRSEAMREPRFVTFASQSLIRAPGSSMNRQSFLFATNGNDFELFQDSTADVLRKRRLIVGLYQPEGFDSPAIMSENMPDFDALPTKLASFARPRSKRVSLELVQNSGPYA